MKGTGRTMTLTGTMPPRLFGAPLDRDPHTIFEYSNVLDITKAWKVKDFKVWIKEAPNFLGMTEPTQCGVEVQLSSDQIIGAANFNDAGDNRAVGWGNLSYFFGDGQYKPATIGFSGATKMLMNSEYWMMPDHIIQNRLILACGVSGSSALESMTAFTLNYIVELEEIEISPSESIVFNIKSQAQDVSLI